MRNFEDWKGVIFGELASTVKFFNELTFLDVCKGIWYGIYFSRKHLIHSFLTIPTGILILFVILYGLNQLLANVFKIKFPCSVLGMLINLVLLVTLSVISNVKYENPNSPKGKISRGASYVLSTYLRLTKPSMNFSLKWINVFFIPSFIILPLSEHITFIECLKIAAVFAVGFVLLFGFDVYFILGLRWLFDKVGLIKRDLDHDSKDEGENIEMNSIEDNHTSIFSSMRDDITTIDLTSLRNTKSEPAFPKQVSTENPFQTETSDSLSMYGSMAVPTVSEPQRIYLREGQRHHIAPVESNGFLETPESSSSASMISEAEEMEDLSLSEVAQNITIFITNYIDWILYGFLFIVSLPFYYVRSIHVFLPYHLGLTVLSYYIALLIPLRWPKLKKIAHPILILTAEILFVCFIGSLIYHKGDPKGFLDDLKYYKTGKGYTNLFNNKDMLNNAKEEGRLHSDFTATPKWPGCGDFLSSLMDISIVSLSLPMFTHRMDFVNNFWVLVPPLLSSTALTYLLYPLVCYHIGIAPSRSIGFIGRSVTLALGTPLITALEGSVSLMAVCTILSGILGVMLGDLMFKVLRIRKDDYVTRGVSLGTNCGAIATAHLLNVDPRAALMSSLSFTIFGTIMIILSSVGTVREFVRSMVGL